MKNDTASHIIARRFGVAKVPSLVSSVSGMAPVTFSQVRSEDDGVHITDSCPLERNYAIHVSLDVLRGARLTMDGKPHPVGLVSPGGTFLFHLDAAPVATFEQRFNLFRFGISKASIDELCEIEGLPVPTDLRRPGFGECDTLLLAMARGVLPALYVPDQVQQLFVDHMALAFHSHLVRTYGGLRRDPVAVPTHLSLGQAARAREMIEEGVGLRISVKDIADACGLPPKQFTRAFQRAFGEPPYRWLLKCRVDKAKQLMLTSGESLVVIAGLCGFASQSHLTRVFTAQVGTGPGAWRRQLRSRGSEQSEG